MSWNISRSVQLSRIEEFHGIASPEVIRFSQTVRHFALMYSVVMQLLWQNVQMATPDDFARQRWVFNKFSSSYEDKFHMKVTCSGTTYVQKVYHVAAVFSLSGPAYPNLSNATVQERRLSGMSIFQVHRIISVPS